jgi:putative ABC transport system permease protein
MTEDKALLTRSVNISWLFKMAWRDSRRNRSRLLLFVSSVILGIAALVAVYSFRDNLQKDIENQAKILAGADLTIDSRKAPSKVALALLDSLGDEQARERSMASMIYFQKNEGSRLVQIRALEGDYPYYGAIETTPERAGTTFRNGRKALVDKTLMLQFDVVPGDSIKVGDVTFVIEGAIDKVPGQTGIAATVAPVVYIPMEYLDKTGLTKQGSRIQYKYYYRYNNPQAAEKVVDSLETILDKEGLDTSTVESQKQETGRSFRDVGRFLALAGFIALLLGCIGVGSAIHVYIGEKLGTIATLRCLGVKSREAFLIYLIQIFFIGLLGAIAGAALGTFIQFLLPAVLKDFIPVELNMQISWPSIGQGVLLGVIISILFALPSLLGVRRVSPLNALRLSFERNMQKFDPLRWLVYLLILLFVWGFTYLQVGGLRESLAFTASVLLAFTLLYALSKLLMWLVRRLMPASLNYLMRQGFANLYRPNNQTVMLTVSIGLSTAFICTLFFVQGILMKRVTLSSGDTQPNMVLFDIQNTQKDEVVKLTESFKLPVMNQVPIVTVRIAEINGKTDDDVIEADSAAKGTAKPDTLAPSARAFRGELRVTFQDTLTQAEEIVKGKWSGKLKHPDDVVYVSLEEGYANRINVKVGDQVTFNVQGVLIKTVVGSLRSVNWTRMQTNFRVVFPTGVLEDAPQFHVQMTRVPDSETSASFQAAVVRNFPNVSVIDLGLVLKVLDEVLSKIGFVIQFMAGFSMATGWIVLISAVLTSKTQRLQESVLLRTLGASRRQILAITALEYMFLGLLAASAGIILAMTGSWALAVYSFETTFNPPWWPIILLLLIICLIVVLTGVLSSRKVLSHPPLEVLNN